MNDIVCISLEILSWKYKIKSTNRKNGEQYAPSSLDSEVWKEHSIGRFMKECSGKTGIKKKTQPKKVFGQYKEIPMYSLEGMHDILHDIAVCTFQNSPANEELVSRVHFQLQYIQSIAI